MYLFDTDLTIHGFFFEYFGILDDIDSNGRITKHYCIIMPYDRSVHHHFWSADKQDVFNQYIDTAVIGYYYTGNPE